MAGGTPVGRAVRVALPARADDRAATQARPPGPAIDVPAGPAARERALHQPARGLDGGGERLIRDLADAEPGRHADLPKRLGHPHVPDPGDEPLLLERLAEPELAGRAKPVDRGRHVELGREDVLPEPPDRAGVERQHRPVAEHALDRLSAEDEPRQPHSLRPSRIDAPAPAQPQVAANDDVPVEAQEEVLADGVDRLEHVAVDRLRDPSRLRPGMR